MPTLKQFINALKNAANEWGIEDDDEICLILDQPHLPITLDVIGVQRELGSRYIPEQHRTGDEPEESRLYIVFETGEYPPESYSAADDLDTESFNLNAEPED